MYEVIFLWALSLVFIILAVIQDLKTREIDNWISFSLVIFALGFRFLYSLFQGDFECIRAAKQLLAGGRPSQPRRRDWRCLRRSFSFYRRGTA